MLNMLGTLFVLKPYCMAPSLLVALNSQGDAWLLLAPDNNCQPAFHILSYVYNYSFTSRLWIRSGNYNLAILFLNAILFHRLSIVNVFSVFLWIATKEQVTAWRQREVREALTQEETFIPSIRHRWSATATYHNFNICRTCIYQVRGINLMIIIISL